jgi:tetratricopeptide (TPR) repeat protein
MSQVKDLLSDLSGDAEPRQVDGRSAESEYAIEHPLMIHQAPLTDAQVALNLYHSAMTYLREGDRMQGNLLNQEALRKDPSLHKRACEKLSAMAQGCSPAEAGPIYYWLGIHFENRRKFKEAIAGYNKAALAFEHLGYQKRQGRALCNLGTVYLKLGDYDHGIEQFEKAIPLNPNDGIAHFNIGMIYYRISSPGEENHDRALDSFAAAIAADPEAYGTAITTRMRAHVYEWEEDLSEVLRRVEMKKQLGARDSSGKSISG